jgi:hypothetical protein
MHDRGVARGNAAALVASDSTQGGFVAGGSPATWAVTLRDGTTVEMVDISGIRSLTGGAIGGSNANALRLD